MCLPMVTVSSSFPLQNSATSCARLSLDAFDARKVYGRQTVHMIVG